MRPKCKTTSVINKIRRHKPKTASECRKTCGVELVSVGTGCAREAYLVCDTELVVKFCRNQDYKYQSDRENKAYHAIMRDRRLSRVRKFLPTIHYYSRKSGVTVTDYVPEKVENRTDMYSKVRDVIFKIASNVNKKNMAFYAGDLHPDNIGVTKEGKYKVLDMGLFTIRPRR